MKLKTKKTLSKRVKITKNGKILRKSIRMGHLKVKMDNSRKLRKAGNQEVDKAHSEQFRLLLNRKK